MARVDYDAFEGLGRMAGVVEGLDPRAAAVIACHIALEREVMVVLERSVPRATYLSNLGYAQKVDVLAAAWAGEDDDAAKVRAALLAYGTLRNRIAHGNDGRIEGAYAALQAAYRALHPKAGDETSVEDIAGGIISFFGEAPTPEELRPIMRGLGQLIEQIGQSFAIKPNETER